MGPQTPASWHRFAPASDLAEGQLHARHVADRAVAVARSRGRLSAFGALCPHRQADLSKGRLEDGALTCPDHLWCFELSTGTCTNVPGARLPIYAVREEDGWIVVELPRR